MVQRMVALGRLAPSQRPQSAEELRGWLAQDANIRAVTGWEIGPYNYREACQRPTVEGDEQPQAPSPEAIQSLRNQLNMLEADRRLTERLANNALWRGQNPPADGGTTYTRGAEAVWRHYNRERSRLNQECIETADRLRDAESLTSIGTLTR